MGLLDKLEQVEIKADSRLPEDDLMFCETHQQAYDESCRALREIRQQWKKAIQAQRDLLGIGQDGSLPYFGSNYRFGITDLNRELEKFHSRFISELTQHFNEKYSVTISTDAIKEHLIPAEPDPYRCDMDTSKEYHRNLRDLSLHYEGTSTLSPREFWLKLLTQKDTELLGIEVKAKSVVEIDDGLAPCFFFKTEEGYTRCRSFDADRARTNCMEGWEEYNQEDIK